MTNDTDLVAMPKAGQVDLGDGDRIASYVAAALGVSLTALLSTAGASGGSYGAEASLEPATMNNVLARQNVWIDGFYRRILAAMGMRDVEVRFRPVVEDPAFRTLQGLTLAVTSGAIFQDELRDKVLEQLDMENLHGSDLPKPNAVHRREDHRPRPRRPRTNRYRQPAVRLAAEAVRIPEGESRARRGWWRQAKATPPKTGSAKPEERPEPAPGE
jgi:hypothetical protein